MSSTTETSNSTREAQDNDEIDLREYWNILMDRRWLVLGVTAAVVLLTLAGTLLTTPVYRAGSSIQIERDTLNVINVEGVTPMESVADRDFYQTQYELLKSRSLALRVIQDTQLTAHPVYAEQMAALAERAQENGKPLTELERERALVDSLLEAVTVAPVRNSRLVNLHVDSTDAALAARLSNTWAEAFIASNLERRFEASSYASKYLEERLAQLKARLEDSEKALVAFASEQQLVSVGEGSPSLAAQNLGELNSALAAAQQERIKAESIWLQARAGDGLGLSQVVASPLIQRLREQRAQLRGEYQNRLATYKPDYPDMQRLASQVSEIDLQIQTEVRHIRAALEADHQASLAREQLLLDRIEQLKGDVLDLQDRSIQYNILRREAETNRQLYDGLLQRYKEIGVAGGVGANNISVVDRAEVPRNPHSPRLPLNLAIGLLLGGFAGVLLAFVLHFLDRAIHSPKQLEALLERPVLGVVPLLAKQTPQQAAADPRSAFSEAYRSVRTALQFSTSHGLPHTLFITSAGPGEGKSTSAAELARNIAQLGKRVLLIDADLRKPSQHRLAGVGNSVGLSNLLAGACSTEEAILQVPALGHDLMLSGPLPPSPPELLAGDRLPALLRELGQQYEVIIIDGPPVLGLADAPLLAHHAEATVLVAAAEATRDDSLVLANGRLQAAHARVLGSLLTRHNPRHGSSGYGYAYYEYGTGQG